MSNEQCADANKLRKIRESEYVKGLQVRMEYDGRVLLGDVLRSYKNVSTGLTYLVVRHFNGDLWPIYPQMSEVDVIG